MEPKNFVCLKCAHYDLFSIGCKAFPEGIPDEITSGKNKHKTPLKSQKNNLTFKAKK